MRKRFGVPAALAAAVGLAALVAGGSPEGALAGGNTASVNYDVPPTGTGTATLAFDTGEPGPLDGLRFVLGGSADMRIQRIVASTGSPDFTFQDAAPRDVTQFFVNNPITADSGQFAFTVANPSDSTAKLHVTARWE